MTIKISCYEGKQDDNKISESPHDFLLYHSVPTYPLECGFQPIQQPADPISGADSICLFAALPLYAFSAGFWILSLLHHLHIFRMVSCTAQQKRILLLLTVLGFLLFFSARLLMPFFSVLSKTVVLHVSLGMGALLSYFLLNWRSASPSPTKD